MNLVECSNVGKAFGKTPALKEISFELMPGKITGLIGRNGAGKTTLLNIIAGHLLPDRGKVKVFSWDPFNNLEVSANLVFIGENVNFPELLSLEEILHTAAAFYPCWNHSLALGLLEYFNIPLHRRHKKLSRGMKSIFNSVFGLSTRCSLTVFDEPTLGMDAAARKDFYRALLKDFMQHPRTVILSSHLLNEVEHLLDEVLLIDRGQKYLHLSTHMLKNYTVGLQGNEKAVKDFIGDTEILYQKKLGKDSVYTVAINSFTREQLREAGLKGIEVIPVSPEETCAYLTAREEGGIDRVFERNQL